MVNTLTMMGSAFAQMSQQNSQLETTASAHFTARRDEKKRMFVHTKGITMKILIAGCGNMGMTYARAFVNSHVVKKDELEILELDKPDILARLSKSGFANVKSDPACVADADLIILAVKPQDSANLMKSMHRYVQSGQIVLSIMAGVKIESIQRELRLTKVIRAMPNLPAQIGMGMTAYCSSPAVSRFEQSAVQNLLATTGKAISVDREELLNAVTAISGSGPAYVYYFMQSMITSAVEMGLEYSAAELLVKQTFTGAMHLYQQNSLSCEEWISKVSSKGGTTEAAIASFEKDNLSSQINRGVAFAQMRASELGK